MFITPVFWATGGTYQLCIQRSVLCKPTIPSNAVRLKGSTFWLPVTLIISFAPLPKVCRNFEVVLFDVLSWISYLRLNWAVQQLSDEGTSISRLVNVMLTMCEMSVEVWGKGHMSWILFIFCALSILFIQFQLKVSAVSWNCVNICYSLSWER